MKVLYIGDIMGPKGVEVVRRVLPQLKNDRQIDIVVAQAENVSEGKSMTPEDMQVLQSIGVDFFTGGNHTPSRPELHPLLEDSKSPVIGPANLPSCPGEGWKYIDTSAGKILVISLLVTTVGKIVISTNPLAKIDAILDQNRTIERAATIVNFHGDYSSEKRVIGYYLDGRVSMVVGDHWHVPTADAMVLPKGTAHISDAGMCGILHSSLGVKVGVIVSRWRDGKINVNQLETEGPLQFNALLCDIDPIRGLATQVEQIQQILD